MRAGGENRVGSAVLVVADDARILALAEATLASKGHVVLLAGDAQAAEHFLTQSQIPVRSVAIRAGISFYEKVRELSQRVGAKAWTFHCHVDDRGVSMEGLDSGADWESPAFGA
jgi:DNA-binding response OmpR family regulator